MSKLMTGCATIDISPQPGVRLAGYPHFPRPNVGVHDPLLATCMYLSDGKTEVALVTMDILFFSKKYAAQVRARVNRLCGIPEKNVLLCCSHTHSGPWAAGNPELEATAGDGDGEPDIDPDYLNYLLYALAKIVIEAKKSAFPGEFGYGTGLCGAEKGVGGNRCRKDGITDPYVCVTAIREADTKKVRCIMTNYALHPTFLHEDSELVSADYPHYVRQTVTEKFAGAIMGFAQGASGDQSSRYFRIGQSFDEAARVGGIMGKVVCEVVDGMAFSGDLTLGVENVEFPIQIRKYDTIEQLQKNVAEKTRIYEELKAAGASYLDVQNANLRMLGAEDMLGYAICLRDGRRVDLRDDENPCEVMAVRIGKLCIVGLQGEIFVEYALKIKEQGDVFVYELSNGCLPGYCYNDEELHNEGYEVGNSMLAPGFGNVLAAHAAELIRKLR